MSFIFEIVLALGMLIGIYFGIGRLVQSSRTHKHARHLHEQFERNVYGKDIENSRED